VIDPSTPLPVTTADASRRPPATVDPAWRTYGVRDRDTFALSSAFKRQPGPLDVRQVPGPHLWYHLAAFDGSWCCRTRRMIVSASLVVIAGVAHDGTTEG